MHARSTPHSNTGTRLLPYRRSYGHAKVGAARGNGTLAHWHRKHNLYQNGKSGRRFRVRQEDTSLTHGIVQQ